jgi:hypothetical protein
VTTYTLQIATDNTFATIVVNQAGIAATTFTPAAPLNATTTYFWRVTAVNTFGSTPSTEPFWSFTTS